MRRIVTILAGAALALALVGPAVAGATDKASNPDATITAQHYGGGHGHGGWHDGGRSRHGYYHRGGRCYGCFGPGSRCSWYGCAFAYPFYGYYGYPYGFGYGYYGGFGCNFDYPCGPPYTERERRWDDRCQCYYNGTTPPGSDKQAPPPSGRAQPAPNQGGQPGPDQGMQPGPDQGMQPGPDQGQQPPPDQGAQPRPY